MPPYVGSPQHGTCCSVSARRTAAAVCAARMRFHASAVVGPDDCMFVPIQLCFTNLLALGMKAQLVQLLQQLAVCSSTMVARKVCCGWDHHSSVRLCIFGMAAAVASGCSTSCGARSQEPAGQPVHTGNKQAVPCLAFFANAA